MGAWEDEHFARVECELGVWGRDRLLWLRSSRAGPGAVEVAAVPGWSPVSRLAGPGVAVRHGRGPMAGAALLFELSEWAAFVAGLRSGEFARLRRTALASAPHREGSAEPRQAAAGDG
ncbi:MULTISPECIES: DUF397 domain-containing protein [Frankia]|uniref:DUF397 domain-containing protein n=1 Tax=Frankia TaxID=1854 RepID=UPI000316B951|nr:MULTISPECIES: DUF397 domain-containing protein [Frankia]